MKKYDEIVVEIEIFDIEDIISTSGGYNDPLQPNEDLIDPDDWLVPKV